MEVCVEYNPVIMLTALLLLHGFNKHPSVGFSCLYKLLEGRLSAGFPLRLHTWHGFMHLLSTVSMQGTGILA